MNFQKLIHLLWIFLFIYQSAFTQDGDSIYFPTDNEWQKIPATATPFNKKKFDLVLNYAQEQKSSGVFFLYKGKILTEQYWQVSNSSLRYQTFLHKKTGVKTLEDVASIQKSVVSILCGIAMSKDLIELEKPVTDYLGKGWSQSKSEDQITVRHLLTMTSGLDDKLQYQQPQGMVWKYNTMAYKHLVKILETVTGTDINTINERWLSDIIGLSHSRWQIAASPNPYRFLSTLRDLGRLGLLILNEGRWQDEALITDEQYKQLAFAPGKVKPNYGFLFWLNQDRSFISTAPNNIITMFGALQRYVYIIPQLSLVVVRLGDKPEDGFNQQFWSLIMDAWEFK